MSQHIFGLLAIIAGPPHHLALYNAQIADELSISLKTVRNHASNIFNKLQVADRTQAAIRAREAGLGL